MIVGVPRETHRHEHRVGLPPHAAARLAGAGHIVVVEKGAGREAHFADRDYEEAGARIVYGREEVFGRAELVCAVGSLTEEEAELLRPGSVVCAFHHLAVAPRRLVERLAALEATLIGYEIIRGPAGELPVLVPISEMAGQMAVHLAAWYLQTEAGGRGVLLGNVPGVPPPTVLVLGAGTVGCSAAARALAGGAHVILLDSDLRRLRAAAGRLDGGAVTVVGEGDRVGRYTAFADVVVGAVLVPGGRAPHLVSEEMVAAMKPGSVILDLAVDQGGCVETSRPTTLADPTFVAHGVVHYCVPNVTSNLARTASRALSHAALPYLAALAGKGLDRALAEDSGLGRGVYLYRGRLVHPGAGATLGMEAAALAGLLPAGGAP